MKKIIAFLLLASTWTFCPAQMMMPLADISRPTADSGSAAVDALSAVVKDNNRILLKWQTSALLSESFFVVERSINGTDFAAISVIKNNTPGAYEFVDDSPVKGKAYYRVKVTAGQSFAYSAIVGTVVSGDVSCKFYPNPVDKALIIRSEWPVDVVIADKFGKPLLSNKLPAGLKIVDVSALEPGIYVITLFQKDANRVITEKLVKR